MVSGRSVLRRQSETVLSSKADGERSVAHQAQETFDVRSVVEPSVWTV